MISQTESFVHLAAAAAISAAMIGVGLGAIGPTAYRRMRARWPWLAGGVLGTIATFALAVAELDFGNLQSAMLFVIVGVIVGEVGGIALLRVGLRGRRVGDHPHCRRCGFDLFGKPADSTICNECGADLNAPRATVVGVRHRRAVPLLAGAFLMIVSLAVGGSVGRAVVGSRGQFSTMRYRPTAWIIDDALGPRSVRTGESGDELLRRLAAGDLSDAVVRRLADVSTRVPARSQQDYIASQVLTLAWARGQIDEPTARALVRRQAEFTLRLAPESTPQRVPFELTPSRHDWAWGGGNVAWKFEASDRVDTLNGVVVPAASRVSIGVRRSWGRQVGFDPGTLYRLPEPLPAGPAEAQVRMTMTVSLVATGRPTIVESVPVVAEGRTTIVPGLTRAFADDGDLDPSLANATATVTTTAATATVAIDAAGGMSHSFVGDAFARDAAGVETSLGEIWLEDGAFEVAAARLPVSPFTLVLRPVAGRAIEMIYTFPTYQHEIVIDATRVMRAAGTPPG